MCSNLNIYTVSNTKAKILTYFSYHSLGAGRRLREKGLCIPAVMQKLPAATDVSYTCGAPASKLAWQPSAFKQVGVQFNHTITSILDNLNFYVYEANVLIKQCPAAEQKSLVSRPVTQKNHITVNTLGAMSLFPE